MKERLWCAVCTYPDDNDWGWGAYSLARALKMVRPYIRDGGYIAVISEGNDPICVQEIREFDP